MNIHDQEMSEQEQDLKQNDKEEKKIANIKVYLKSKFPRIHVIQYGRHKHYLCHKNPRQL